jgi:hypothetical protein
MKETLLKRIAVGLTNIGQSKRKKEECERNLRMIWSVTFWYSKERNLSPETVIDVVQLRDRFADGQIPKCPLGDAPYEPFVSRLGPRCPHKNSGHEGPQCKGPSILIKGSEVVG